MSEEEINRVIADQNFFQFKKEMAKVGETTFMKRFTNAKDKHADEDE